MAFLGASSLRLVLPLASDFGPVLFAERWARSELRVTAAEVASRRLLGWRRGRVEDIVAVAAHERHFPLPKRPFRFTRALEPFCDGAEVMVSFRGGRSLRHLTIEPQALLPVLDRLLGPAVERTGQAWSGNGVASTLARDS